MKKGETDDTAKRKRGPRRRGREERENLMNKERAKGKLK